MIIIAGLITGAVVLVLLIILFTIRARVRIAFRDELLLRVSCFGRALFEIPQKQKRYSFRDYTPKKLAKRGTRANIKGWRSKLFQRGKEFSSKISKKLSNFFFGAKKSKKQKKTAKKDSPKPKFSDTADLFLRIIKLFFSRFFGRLHIKVARIRIKVGSSDAAKTALLHSAVCAAMQPALILIDKHSNLDGMRKADIDISPDFLREDIEFDVDLIFSISVMALLGVLIRVMISAIVGWNDIQPKAIQNDQDTDKTTTNT